jgi:hypothetical protein
MSFRQFGGLQYAARHNAVSSNYNTANNLSVTQNVGQPNSYINFESDISGNITIKGNLDVSGNLNLGNNCSIYSEAASNGNPDAILFNTDGYHNVFINQDGIHSPDFIGNATTATSIYGGAANEILYQTGVSTTGFIAPPTTSGQVLTYNLSSTPQIEWGNSQWLISTAPQGIYYSGNVGIGTNTPSSTYPLNVGGSVNATSYNATSDYRIKEYVKSLDETFVVDKLNPVTYLNKKSYKQDIGLIAHELQEVFPFLVTGDKDGEEFQSVNYIGLIGLLIKEVKELKKEVKILKQLKGL